MLLSMLSGLAGGVILFAYFGIGTVAYAVAGAGVLAFGMLIRETYLVMRLRRKSMETELEEMGEIARRRR